MYAHILKIGNGNNQHTKGGKAKPTVNPAHLSSSHHAAMRSSGFKKGKTSEVATRTGTITSTVYDHTDGTRKVVQTQNTSTVLNSTHTLQLRGPKA